MADVRTLVGSGELTFELIADWEQLPDLHTLVLFLDESFQELQEAASR